MLLILSLRLSTFAQGAAFILQVDTYPRTIYSAAAIQELNQRFEETQQAAKARNGEIQELKERLAALEKIAGNK